MKYAVLSLDVEDWYHLDYFKRSSCDTSHSLLDGFYAYNEVIGRLGLPTSYFVLGELARTLGPALRQAAAAGHDIGSHGWDHRRPLTRSPGEFAEELRRSKAELEDALGRPVGGYRAPCFSLDRTRLDCVEEAGHCYDSSRIQFSGHPLYGTIQLDGFDTVAQSIFRKGGFFEFELSTLRRCSRNLPISGGGYLRIFPWWLTRHLMRQYLAKADLYVLYIHPFELSPQPASCVPGGTPLRTRFRFAYGRARVKSRLLKLISLLSESGVEFTTFGLLRQKLLAAN